MPIPPFDEAGNLPVGIHGATLAEIEARFGYTVRRQRMVAGLNDACRSLKEAGGKQVYLDGSFVSTKSEPGDFDACYEVSDDFDPDLLDPELLDFQPGRKSQRARYGGEFYLAEGVADFDSVTGKAILFVEFYQHDRRTGNDKGIITIDLLQEEL